MVSGPLHHLDFPTFGLPTIDTRNGTKESET
jgi:hypothetical protein